MHTPKKIIQIPIDKLFAHPENPNRMSKSTFEKLKRHIGQSHNYEPVIVRRHPAIEGAFEIINGHHRARALRELGESYADCVEWEVDDDQTRILLATLNRLGGRDRLDAKINLIKNLSEKFNSRELAKLLPDTKTVIEKLKSIEAQIKSEQSMAAWADPSAGFDKLTTGSSGQASPPYETEMPNSMVFFLNDEQMRIVEAAIGMATKTLRHEENKKLKAGEMADAITRIAEEWMRRIEN
ncbi:MAG: ParB/RepB/Spo0J family partition protein [Phycisphaerae bacterium]|jgi:hypothetical protein